MRHRYQPNVGNPDRTTTIDRGLSCARTHEPAVHTRTDIDVELAGVATAGRLDHYRSTPLRLDSTMVRPPDSSVRQGAPAEPWFAVWLRAYEVITDHDNLAASYAGRKPLRIRPITWRFPTIP